MENTRDYARLREGLQQQSERLNESWGAVQVEAQQAKAELLTLYDDIVQAFRTVVERRRERQQKPLVRLVRHYPWLPLVAGVAAIAVAVIAARTRATNTPRESYTI